MFVHREGPLHLPVLAFTTLALSMLLAACAPTPPVATPTSVPGQPTSAPAKPASPSASPSGAPATPSVVAEPSTAPISASTKPAQDVGKLGVGLSVAKTFEFLPAYVAEDRGFWKRRGLSVEITSFAGDAGMQQAFAAGAIDMGLGSASSALAAINKGLETRLVGAISNRISLMGLVVNQSVIKTREDLKGKTIGVTSPNSITDILVKDVSKKLTGDEQEGIKRAALGGLDAQIAALKTGQTQGFVWTLDGVFEVEKQGLGKYLLTFGDEFPDFAFESIIARKQVIDQRAASVQAFLEGWSEAVAYMNANRDYTLQIFQSKMETAPDIGARVYDVDMQVISLNATFTDRALDAAANTLVQTNVLKDVPPQQTWVEKRFLPVKWQ